MQPPFEPGPPSVSISVDEIGRLKERTDKLSQFVMDQNQVNYPDDLQRLPDEEVVSQRLRKQSFTGEECRAALWIESKALRVLPLRTSSAADMHLVYASGNPSIVRMLAAKLSDQLSRRFAEVEQRTATLERIRHYYTESPWKLDGVGSGRAELSRFFYVTCDLLDYQALLEDLRHAGTQDFQQDRERRAWDTLLKIASPADAPNGTAGTQSPFPTPVRRAVDLPEWQSYVRNKIGGVSWAQVINEFGSEMMIRIILRRGDYAALLGQLQKHPGLQAPETREYVRKCLAKVRANDGLGEADPTEFSALETWLAANS